MSVCLISLGSNQGSRHENLDAAVARLAAHPQVQLLSCSRWRETAPVGGPEGQDAFLNGALTLETALAPLELLAVLQKIECDLGRQRAERWGPRTIDLDLLLYDEQVLTMPTLTLPHPRMAWRRFVLEPAAEAAGSMVHPTTRWSIAKLLEHLNDSAPYVAIAGPIAAGKTWLAERLAQAISGRSILEQPDWERLEVFYADPAGHAWETELEFLDERTRLLRNGADFGSPDNTWTAPKGRGSPSPGQRPGEIGSTQAVLSAQRANHSANSSPVGTTGEQDQLSSPGHCLGLGEWQGLRPTEPEPRTLATTVGMREQRLPTPLVVSDFWFDQSAAFARAWLPAERLCEFLDRFEHLRQTVVAPRLIVLLDAPADELLTRIRGRGRPCERHLTVEPLARIRQALLDEIERPDIGPVLRTDSNDPDAVFAEVLAAVRGME
jgi:2-amino-4-hydroxy-6-hydroxymethyldihydropteridine diphosphokinase